MSERIRTQTERWDDRCAKCGEPVPGSAIDELRAVLDRDPIVCAATSSKLACACGATVSVTVYR